MFLSKEKKICNLPVGHQKEVVILFAILLMQNS